MSRPEYVTDEVLVKRDGSVIAVTQRFHRWSEWKCHTCSAHFLMIGVPSHCPQCGCRFNTFHKPNPQVW